MSGRMTPTLPLAAADAAVVEPVLLVPGVSLEPQPATIIATADSPATVPKILLRMFVSSFRADLTPSGRGWARAPKRKRTTRVSTLRTARH